MNQTECPSHTVLIVEDDPDIRESLRDVLEEEGYVVTSATNGREGLDRISEIERPCLVLLDLLMPLMDGSEFLARLRQTNAHATTPVVIVSAWTDEARRVRGATQGFLQKPVSVSSLIETVRKFCSPVSPGR